MENEYSTIDVYVMRLKSKLEETLSSLRNDPAFSNMDDVTIALHIARGSESKEKAWEILKSITDEFYIGIKFHTACELYREVKMLEPFVRHLNATSETF